MLELQHEIWLGFFYHYAKKKNDFKYIKIMKKSSYINESDLQSIFMTNFSTSDNKFEQPISKIFSMLKYGIGWYI